MSLYSSVLRPLAFRLDPETAHNIAVAFISRGLIRAKGFSDPRFGQQLFGIPFSSPLGLAAGFDKNAVAVDHWHRLGFSHAELGTVTWHPQPGNPKPRLFRLPAHRALINRMGFNNEGAAKMAEKLQAAHARVPIGINLGKSKVTALEEAAEDYRNSFQALRSYGSYFVINVSSPNTPGLRSLQEKGPLLEIISAIRQIDASVPLFVKMAPDLDFAALDEVIDVALQSKLTGLIATNTTIARDTVDGPNSRETGGLSGAPLKAPSDRALAHIAKSVGKDLVLFGVGGIFSGGDLFDKIALGAHMCQIYTGWIYRGPGAIPAILRELADILDRDGIKDLSQVRGSAI